MDVAWEPNIAGHSFENDVEFVLSIIRDDSQHVPPLQIWLRAKIGQFKECRTVDIPSLGSFKNAHQNNQAQAQMHCPNSKQLIYMPQMQLAMTRYDTNGTVFMLIL